MRSFPGLCLDDIGWPFDNLCGSDDRIEFNYNVVALATK